MPGCVFASGVIANNTVRRSPGIPATCRSDVRAGPSWRRIRGRASGSGLAMTQFSPQRRARSSPASTPLPVPAEPRGSRQCRSGRRGIERQPEERAVRFERELLGPWPAPPGQRPGQRVEHPPQIVVVVGGCGGQGRAPEHRHSCGKAAQLDVDRERMRLPGEQRLDRECGDERTELRARFDGCERGLRVGGARLVRIGFTPGVLRGLIGSAFRASSPAVLFSSGGTKAATSDQSS